MFNKNTLILLLFISIYALSLSHPGAVDEQGGHIDKKTGKYHYHNPKTTLSQQKQTTKNSIIQTKDNIAIYGKVIAISDGDTIRVLVDKTQYKVRFYGIDAPEKTQDFGQKAKQALSDLIYNKEVKVEITDTDRYGRSVGKVYLNEEYINIRMVEKGLARWYKTYAKNETEIEAAENKAKDEKIGIWSNPNQVAPWDYRKEKKINRIHSFITTSILELSTINQLKQFS